MSERMAHPAASCVRRIDGEPVSGPRLPHECLAHTCAHVVDERRRVVWLDQRAAAHNHVRARLPHQWYIKSQMQLSLSD